MRTELRNFSVSDLVEFQRNGSLDLSPWFQRRSVWKPKQRSYFIDSVLRGLPIPPLIFRTKYNAAASRAQRQVVDGQQRLRALFGFVAPDLLPKDFPDGVGFALDRAHGADLAGKTFSKLPADARRQLMSYEIVAHTLPSDTLDGEILDVFARMNSTGSKLKDQELRNAEFFGAFKTSMYRLAHANIEYWRKWRIHTEDQIVRMKEVETTSDLVINLIHGITGKSQPRIKREYADFDDEFPNSEVVESRFSEVMIHLDDAIGEDIASTDFRNEIHFYTLFLGAYDTMWGLGSKLTRSRPKSLPSKLRGRFLEAAVDLKGRHLPEEVVDAMSRASSDAKRRQIRFEYFRDRLFT